MVPKKKIINDIEKYCGINFKATSAKIKIWENPTEDFSQIDAFAVVTHWEEFNGLINKIYSSKKIFSIGL